jgi:YD repeat-containing protein
MLYRPLRFTTKQKVKYTIDEINGLQKIEDPNGNTIDVTPNGLVSSTGAALTFERDAAGRIVKIIEPDASPTDGNPPGVLQYVYDTNGNLVQFIDQTNSVTQYFYENPAFPHYLTKIQDPLGRAVIRNVFDNNGRLIGVCDANGNPATLAGCDQFDPDAIAKTQTIVNARGFRTDLFLDERGNILRERRFLDGSTVLETVRTYDANNNLLSETDPQGNVKTYTYDSQGNVLSQTEGGRTTSATYNACNQILTQTDSGGNTTTYEYDATGCLVRFVKDAANNQTEYRYNAAGQVTDMIDAVGNHWRWQYDGAGFLQSMTDPSNKTATFSYNGAGDLLSQTDRNGRRIDFAYDSAHHPVRETWDTSPARVTATATTRLDN